MNRAELLACPQCDLLQSDAAVPRPRKALCARCGATLYQRSERGLESTLALTLAALGLFGIATSFPLLSLELQGERTQATLAGAAAALWTHTPLVAALFFFAAVAMPLAQLVALCWLLAPLHFGSRAPGFGAAFRLFRFAAHWGMVDVLVLGALIAYVKLDHLANVEAGVGLWSLAALMLVTASIKTHFDPRELWSRASAL